MVSVSKYFGIGKNIGIGLKNLWYRKKYQYQFRKNLVPIKVSVSVSKKIGIGVFVFGLFLSILDPKC